MSQKDNKAAKSFEDLWIWQEARELAKLIYLDFADLKDYGFKDQIQRAGVSSMNNIAEGFERDTNPEFSRFLKISKGSCGEALSMYFLAEDLSYLDSETADKRRNKARRLSAGIASLISHLDES